MELKEYDVMYKTEENHWWFKGKREIVFSQISPHLHGKKNLKILDIGCGTGIIMKNFQKYGKVSGVDIEPKALNFCCKRGLSNLSQADIMGLPFKNSSFDVVGMFDVLYHKEIKDDIRALKEIFRVMKPGGILVLTDSADMKLWSSHDIAAHAKERYTISKLSAKLKPAGFKIIKISYFNTLLYPIIFMVRKLDSLSNKKGPITTNIKETNPFLNFILYQIFVLENQLLKMFNLPFGVSIFLIAKKQ